MLTLKWIVGDITKDEVDVIVNAANSQLLGGGGVDGAIHKAAGPKLLKECGALRSTAEFKAGLDAGEMVATFAYNLPAHYVFHAVGPVYLSHNKKACEDRLISCYVKCIERAKKWGMRSIAFPAISTGVYGYPKHMAAEAVWVALNKVGNLGPNLEVRFYFMNEIDLTIHQDEIMELQRGILL